MNAHWTEGDGWTGALEAARAHREARGTWTGIKGAVGRWLDGEKRRLTGGNQKHPLAAGFKPAGKTAWVNRVVAAAQRSHVPTAGDSSGPAVVPASVAAAAVVPAAAAAAAALMAASSHPASDLGGDLASSSSRPAAKKDKSGLQKVAAALFKKKDKKKPTDREKIIAGWSTGRRPSADMD